MYSDEKTIPFRLTPADLENLRMLRRRMNSSYSIQEGEEEDEMSGESIVLNSDIEPTNQKVDTDKSRKQ
jgi:hypothetical protein